MPDKCILCGAGITFLSGRKTSDGSICKECSKNIPRSIPARILNLVDLQTISSYEKRVKTSDFSITASYGKLHIDELHGYVAIADKVSLEGKLVEPFEIYDLMDLRDVGLYPVKPRAEKNNIVCDVEFSCQVSHVLPVPIKVTVKAGTCCSYKRIDDSHVSWDEPGELSMFRNMFNQAARTALERQIKARVPELTKEGLDLFQAESAFLLRDGYTVEDVEDHRKRLTQAFQPKNDADNTEVYLEAIDYYYNIIARKIAGRMNKEADQP